MQQSKRLYLSQTDKKISGVCGGIAAYIGVDSTLIRLGVLLVTFVTGLIPGILVYIVAAIITPKEDEV